MKDKKEISSLGTSKILLTIARKHFSTYGYKDTSLESIVEEAGVTRGAIYHHFKNKKSLFKAVLSEVQCEVGLSVEKESTLGKDPWEELILGCVGFVESATKMTNKRILLIDAPNVIEWSEWKKMDNENSVLLLEEQLVILRNSGNLIDFDIKIISHMISGALNDLSIFIAETGELDKLEVYKGIEYLLSGFRKYG